MKFLKTGIYINKISNTDLTKIMESDPHNKIIKK